MQDSLPPPASSPLTFSPLCSANHQIRKLEAFNRELEKKQEVIDRDLSLKTNEIFLISTAEKRVEAEWTSKVAGLQDELSHIIEDLELSV